MKKKSREFNILKNITISFNETQKKIYVSEFNRLINEGHNVNYANTKAVIVAENKWAKQLLLSKTKE